MRILAANIVTVLLALAAVANAGDTVRITQANLIERLEARDDTLIVLDVRTAEEFIAGHVPGARNISHDQLAARLQEFDALRSKEVVVYCRSGRRATLAADILKKAGFTKVKHLEGDYLAWEAARQPVEKSASEP